LEDGNKKTTIGYLRRVKRRWNTVSPKEGILGGHGEGVGMERRWYMNAPLARYRASPIGKKARLTIKELNRAYSWKKKIAKTLSGFQRYGSRSQGRVFEDRIWGSRSKMKKALCGRIKQNREKVALIGGI